MQPPLLNGNQIGLRLFLLVASSGLFIFIIISALAQFSDKTLNTFFQKEPSLASMGDKTPKVDLKVLYKEQYYDGVINISENDSPLILKWSSSGGPKECSASSFGLIDKDEKWAGPKNISGGTARTKVLNKNNAYVYTIDCVNEFGDGFGDSITVNVGAKKNSLEPYISDFVVESEEGLTFEQPEINIKSGSKTYKFKWNKINLNTSYSICVSTGSWNNLFNNSDDNFSVLLKDKKLYSFTLYCSNETSSVTDSKTILVN